MNKMNWTIQKWNDVLSIVNGKNQRDVVSDDGAYPIIGSGGEIGRATKFLCEAGATVVHDLDGGFRREHLWSDRLCGTHRPPCREVGVGPRQPEGDTLFDADRSYLFGGLLHAGAYGDTSCRTACG